jgi:hypothetical protein
MMTIPRMRFALRDFSRGGTGLPSFCPLFGA